MSKINICGIKFDNISRNEALRHILNLSEKASIFFLNADCLYKAQKDEEYRSILNSANLVLADGIGLNLTTRLFGGKIKEDCNGTDFFPLLINKAKEEGWKIFFLGAKEGVAAKAAESVQKQIPEIQIVGTNSGYFDNDETVIRKVNNSRADLLFVAMGAPLQEKWIARNREELSPRLCLGVGALFDYISGNIPRAPKFLRELHLEWLWRIFIEPKRMFKRYIIDGLQFFWLVLKQKLKTR